MLDACGGDFYDERGQTTSVGELSTIEYDFFDRVRRVVKKDGTELLFAYDPQSRRIFKQVTNAGTVSSVRYVTGVYEQHDTFTIRNVYLQNLILASERVEAGTVKAVASYLNDHHGGFYLKKEDAFTQGNVISNIGTGTSSIDMDLLNKHETLHIWQNRIFGPIFQIVCVAWFIVGGLVGVVIGLFHPSEFGSIVETAAYDDNPWEYWAYKNQNNWPPAGSNPIDRW